MESGERKILIVEDEGLIAADLQLRLEHAGYRVSAIAASATEAMEAIRETPPDLVLMDIRIRGDLDGIEVAQQVRQEFDVPVVYLTSYDDRATLDRASESQPFGYIKKPIASASLPGSIEMALSKHKFERYLREQREWFTASFAAVPDGVIVTDGTGRVCYLNTVAEALTGWKADEALNVASTEVLKLYDDKSGRGVEDFVPVTLLQSQTTALPPNLCLRHRNGPTYAIEGSIAPRYREGQLEGTLITFKDVTLARFEQKLARQDATQGALIRMASGISRQLDLELGVVADESARLLDSLSLDSSLRGTAEIIEKAALDAYAVSGRLQTFARQPNIRARVVKINEVLAPLEIAWKRLIPTLRLETDSDPRPVQADPWQLTRALVTILLHARNTMQPESDVTLAVSCPEIEGMREWARIRLTYTVPDENAEVLERAFEPTWGSDSEDLPTAYRRIREMGGLFTANMAQTNEANIEIFLSRIQHQVEAAAEPIAELPPEAPQPAILLVEANPEVRRVLHAHFERHGYNLLETGSCEEALLLARLYEGPIPLAIAHPAEGDWARADLTVGLSAVKPGISIRLLAGYWEECQAPASPGWSAATRYLNKWDLLEWANRAIAKALTATSAQ